MHVTFAFNKTDMRVYLVSSDELVYVASHTQSLGMGTICCFARVVKGYAC